MAIRTTVGVVVAVMVGVMRGTWRECRPRHIRCTSTALRSCASCARRAARPRKADWIATAPHSSSTSCCSCCRAARARPPRYAAWIALRPNPDAAQLSRRAPKSAIGFCVGPCGALFAEAGAVSVAPGAALHGDRGQLLPQPVLLLRLLLLLRCCRRLDRRRFRALRVAVCANLHNAPSEKDLTQRFLGVGRRTILQRRRRRGPRARRVSGPVAREESYELRRVHPHSRRQRNATEINRLCAAGR